METALTAGIPLLMMAGMLRGLQNGFYMLHVGFTLALCWLVQERIGQPEMFSQVAVIFALAAHFASINIVTLCAYAYDKRASINRTWRIPERTLHAFALIGGTPGAFLGQKLLRHKNRKQSFQSMFWLILVVQLVVAAGLFNQLVRFI